MHSLCVCKTIKALSGVPLSALCRRVPLWQTLRRQPLPQCSLIPIWRFASKACGSLTLSTPFRQFSLSSSVLFGESWPVWQGNGPNMAEQRYCVEYAKRGTAGCKKCKDKIMKGLVRIGKIVPNPFSESAGEMKEWYHVKCIFEKLERARATTKKIEDITDLEGWEELQDEDKELINKHVSGKKELLVYACHACLCFTCSNTPTVPYELICPAFLS